MSGFGLNAAKLEWLVPLAFCGLCVGSIVHDPKLSLVCGVAFCEWRHCGDFGGVVGVVIGVFSRCSQALAQGPRSLEFANWLRFDFLNIIRL